MLSDWELRKSNATLCLLPIYRQLREVLESKLLLNEKEHLFVRAHLDYIRDRAWLVRPDLYEIGSLDFKGPIQREGSGSSRLLNYLDDLGSMLEYSKHAKDLLDAVDAVTAVMGMDLPITESSGQKISVARKDELAKHVPRLEAAFKALRLEPRICVRSPIGGYFWDCYSHQQWIDSLRNCAAGA